MDNNYKEKKLDYNVYYINKSVSKILKKKKKIRLGRGQGSGKGGTCGRGHKGDKSRSGYSKKIGFEGGQMPIHKRIPKYGFRRKNISKKKIIKMNLDEVQNIIKKNKIDKGEIICKEILLNNKKKNILLKILMGRKNLISPIKISANKFSKNAIKNIKNSGGEVFIC